MELLKRCLRSRLDVLQVLKKLRLPAEQFDPPGINQPMLPTELILDSLAFLDVRNLVRCMRVSRRFFSLVSSMLRQKTGALLCSGDSKITFEIGLPSDGIYHRRHVLYFSCLEPSADYAPSGPGELSPSESEVSTAKSLDSMNSERWTSPRVAFTFSTKDVPFPIDIETPFESFRTILWRVYINRTPRPRDPTGSPCTQSYKSLVTKGLERIRQIAFASEPRFDTLTLSDDSCPSLLHTKFLPASNVHYKGTFKHGGDLWHYPFVLSSLVSEGEEVNDWRTQPCTCGAQDTYGIQFEKLSLNCGYILKAYEVSMRREEH